MTIIREPVPRPEGAYTLHATVYAPEHERVYAEGLVSGSSKLGGGYHEVVARVPAHKVGPFVVRSRGFGPAFSQVPASALKAIDTLGAIRLEVSDGTHAHLVSLSGPGRNEVSHKLARTRYRHVSLGRFGWMHVWMTARAKSPQIDVILNWHTGRWDTEVGDVSFRSARILLPDGVRWIPAFSSDTVIEPPYLVKPGSYYFPQRSERPFRFAALLAGDTYSPPWAGLGTQPDLPLMGFRVPPLTGASVSASEWRSKLAALQPTIGTIEPTSALWPAAGVTYGGMTGGDDMHPLDGVRWIAGGQSEGFERYAIEQLRYRARHRGCLYEADGSVVRPTAGTWRMYDSQFERGEVGPYRFPPRWDAPHIVSPEVFSSIDAQHLVREWNHNALLALVAADPLARQYVHMEAAKTLMTFWPKEGDRAYRWPGAQAGKGTGLGRAEAWGAMVIAHALTLGADPAMYAPWIARYVNVLHTAQMPSGLFQINQGKESRNPPFSATLDGTAIYLVGSGLEECYHALALHALSAHDGRIPAMLSRHALGMERLAWHGGGVWSHSARGLVSTGARYTTRDEWPQSLHDALASGSAIPTNPYVDGYHVAYAIAALRSEVLLKRYTNTSSVAAAVAKIRSWNVTPPGGTPIEQVWALLSVWGAQ